MARRGITRRQLIESGVKACAAGSVLHHTVAGQTGAPAMVKSDAGRPAMPQGVASGDVSDGRAVVWSRSDRPARMLVEYATTEKFEDRKSVV